MGFWAMVVAYLIECVPLLLLVIFKHDFKAEEAASAEGVDTYLSESHPRA